MDSRGFAGFAGFAFSPHNAPFKRLAPINALLTPVPELPKLGKAPPLLQRSTSMRHAVSPVTHDAIGRRADFGPAAVRNVMAGWVVRAGAVSM